MEIQKPHFLAKIYLYPKIATRTLTFSNFQKVEYYLFRPKLITQLIDQYLLSIVYLIKKYNTAKSLKLIAQFFLKSIGVQR